MLNTIHNEHVSMGEDSLVGVSVQLPNIFVNYPFIFQGRDSFLRIKGEMGIVGFPGVRVREVNLGLNTLIIIFSYLRLVLFYLSGTTNGMPFRWSCMTLKLTQAHGLSPSCVFFPALALHG